MSIHIITMINKIKPEVLTIYKQLENAAFQAFFVGGCVRDLLLDREISDWDITTDATPEQIQNIFPRSFYDNSFGTVGVPFTESVIASSVERDEAISSGENKLGKNYVEITTFRTEIGYSD